ncbi:MAG: DUF58 domain-containing protein [Gemmataceae bacterium]|nr:DUF58 domain-containing protein [Gemmataceae bacterium]
MAEDAHRWWYRAAHYDVFPELSAKVRRFIYTPLGILVAASVVAFLCGLAIHPRVFALGGGLLAVVALGSGWPWLTLRGIRSSITFERLRATEGETIKASVTVVNHWPWPAWGLALQGGFLQTAQETSAISGIIRLGQVPARSQTEHQWDFTPLCRGEYPLTAPLLISGFPFGVWEAKRRVAVAQRLLVWPKTFPVGPVPQSDDQAIVDGNVARNKVGSAGDIIGVRPYRRGDSPRRIHWPQSARHDRLIVCELQSMTRPVVRLVVDTNPAVHTGGPDPNGSREWAIRLAASFAKGWLEAGVQVGLIAPGATIAPASGLEQMYRILDSLARLSNDKVVPLADLLVSPGCRSGSSALQLVITTDRALASFHGFKEDQRRWVVLVTAGFATKSPAEVNDFRLPSLLQPWLVIDSPQRIAYLLRYGWSEARHGS